jgi:5-dehydro-2-deoxygluconokinase
LKSAVLTRVGDEHMGRFIREQLVREGVDVRGVKTDPERLTALVLLGIRDEHQFPLIFYRENCADMAIDAGDFDAGFIASAKALLVTGTHFTTASVDRASRQAIAYARQAGTKVVLDIDYRPVLWGLTGHGLGEERFVASDTVSAHLQGIVPDCDLIVGTEEEIHIAGGSTDTVAALRRLRSLTKATFVVKRGAAGCTIFTDAIPGRFEDAIDCPGFPVDVFNVLGAGDGFMAGLLRGWLRGADWRKSAAYANACGALVVSRHGCAPAMPSWEELAHYLDRSDRTAKLHEDPSVIRLHRATTARQNWPQVTALAFDHRRQFEDLASKHGADSEKIIRFKELIAQAAGNVPSTGIILDDRFGRAALHRFSDGARWIARPVELPGSIPLAFEAGSDLTTALRLWPSRQVVKCLVIYHADDPAELRQAQEAQLLKLQSACQTNGLEWLLEIIPPERDSKNHDAAIAAAIERLYGIGILPDWWKLPPMTALASWQAVAGVVRKHDPHCHGILILGLDADETALQKSFAAAAGEPLVKGFAIGRSIFWAVAKQWFAGAIGDEQAIATIEKNYRRVHSLWQTARKAAAETLPPAPARRTEIVAS